MGHDRATQKGPVVPHAGWLSITALESVVYIKLNFARAFLSCFQEYVFERQSLKNTWNKLWPNLEGKKDFNDDHREEITDLVQSIPEFQECDGDIETWMAYDAEDCGFQMLNTDEQEESDPINDEKHEDEDNNKNESS
ncbi:hypothetical protein TNCV_3423921 [Trichonephila clavipes]|nr:hypothetical protein TNCV_3423921 [Trichonephila clavipes]